MADYEVEVEQYRMILTCYQALTDVDHAQAFSLMQGSLVLAERFSEIFFEVRREEKLTKTKDAALKDRMENIYKILREVHVGCRMIWSRGKEAG